nr:MAG TPA: ATP dependent DNA helicase [Caudoviricetes sp.]
MEDLHNLISHLQENILEEAEGQRIEEEIKGFDTLDFALSYEQLQAVTKIIKFINSKSPTKEMLLIGGAGTGKSSVLSQVITYLNNHNYDYVACAPTHKARLNLEKLTKSETLTLHQLLQLRPNIEIALLNLRELEFKCGLTKDKKNHIPRLIIIDECSMITTELYTFIQEELIKKRGVKLLYVGE